jgi:glycosyltransferase involved in cell wall biosynthesis
MCEGKRAADFISIKSYFMKAQPLATIIITSYNYGRYLNETIESALNQTYSNTEVIVVDDGSTDNSREIIATYGNKVIQILKENAGQASSFNIGFSRSKGQVIFFLDSDDKLLPQTVENAVVHFQDPEINKVHWPLWLIDEDGNKTGEIIPEKQLPEGDFRENFINYGPDYDVVVPTSGNAWRRSFLDNVLPMPEKEFTISPDLYLFTLSPIYGSMTRLPDPQGSYRGHSSNNGWGRALDDVKLEKDMIRKDFCYLKLSEHLKNMGIEVDINEWKQSNWDYLWQKRLWFAKKDIIELVPTGEEFAIVNEDKWGGQIVPGRVAIPFPERNGTYWGWPINDDEAIGEVKRLRSKGVRYIFFWWVAFTWLDIYPDFKKYLISTFECILTNDRLIAFDLKLENKTGTN